MKTLKKVQDVDDDEEEASGSLGNAEAEKNGGEEDYYLDT